MKKTLLLQISSCIPASLPTQRASDTWTILPQSKEAGGGLAAMKGGKADAELRKIQKQKRLSAPVQVPLFTSPLEADPTGNGKVSG